MTRTMSGNDMLIEEDKEERKGATKPVRITKEKFIIACGFFLLGYFCFGIFNHSGCQSGTNTNPGETYYSL